MIILCILILPAVLIAICLLMFYRNNWVYRERSKILDLKPISIGLEEYHKLPSYDYILFHFWIWDIEKFKKIQTNKKRIL